MLCPMNTDQQGENAQAETEDQQPDPHADVIAGVRLAHPGVGLYTYESASSGLFFVHRRATRGERDVYRKLTRAEKRSDAQDALTACILWPPKEELRKVIDENPFVVEMLETAILNASGLHLDAVAKKA